MRWLGLTHALRIDLAQLASIFFIGRNWCIGLNNWVGVNGKGLSIGIHAHRGGPVVRVGRKLVVPELDDEVAVRVNPELTEWWASLCVRELLLHVLCELLQVEINAGSIVGHLSGSMRAYAVLFQTFENGGYLVVGHELCVPLDEQVVPGAYGVVDVEHTDNTKMSGGIIFT